MRSLLLTPFVLLALFPAPLPASEAPPAQLPVGTPDTILRNRFASPRVGLNPPLMHCVVIVDTDAVNIREWLRYNYANLSAYLFTPVWQHGQLGDWRILYGSVATPANTIHAIRSLPIGPTDTLLVYYAGHGGIKRSDGRHYLTMNRGELARAQVANEITAKHPYLGILLTDCCSSFYTSIPLPQRQPTAMQRNANWEPIQQLFFGLNGFIDVTAARPRQLAWTYPHLGSVFTFAFCSVLIDSPAELAQGERLIWSRFLKQVTARTGAIFRFEQPCHPFYLGGW